MQFEHQIAQWEKKWGRLKFRNQSVLKSHESKRFTMFIGTISHHGRALDKQGRIWVGQEALQDFNPGDMVMVELSGEVVYVRRKT